MTEDVLSTIGSWIYMPSILALVLIILGSLFLEIRLPVLFGKKRVLGGLATVLLTLIVFVATLILAFSMGGCFENCSGQKADEIGTIVGGIANWVYIYFIVSRMHRKI